MVAPTFDFIARHKETLARMKPREIEAHQDAFKKVFAEIMADLTAWDEWWASHPESKPFANAQEGFEQFNIDNEFHDEGRTKGIDHRVVDPYEMYKLVFDFHRISHKMEVKLS
jgi:hypothetical protein